MTQSCAPSQRVASAALALTLAATVSAAAPTSVAHAQAPVPVALRGAPAAPPDVRQPPQMSGNRGTTRGERLRGMGVGAAIGGVLSLGYYLISDNGERGGRCGPATCALPYLSLSGAVAGLFVAGDRAAQRRVETPRVGNSLEFRVVELPILGPPITVEARDSLVAVATDSGVQLLSTTPRPGPVRRRGAGLSGIRAAAIGAASSGVDEPRLFVGTATALWEGALGAGTLSRVFDGRVDAMNVEGPAILAATGGTLRIRRVVSGAPRTDSLTLGTSVQAITYDPRSQHWWVTSDSALFEVAADGERPSATRRAAVPGLGGAIAASPEWIAVALGGDGVALWPRTALSGAAGSGVSPTLFRGEPRFAFDVAFANGSLFVAGGVDGLTRIDLTGTPRIAGSSRQVTYATSISNIDGVLWVGDRSRSRVVRITLQ